jgi:hypothetical protein
VEALEVAAGVCFAGSQNPGQQRVVRLGRRRRAAPSAPSVEAAGACHETTTLVAPRLLLSPDEQVREHAPPSGLSRRVDEQRLVVGESSPERSGEKPRPEGALEPNRRLVAVRLVQRDQGGIVEAVTSARCAEPPLDLGRRRGDVVARDEGAFEPLAETLWIG